MRAPTFLFISSTCGISVKQPDGRRDRHGAPCIYLSVDHHLAETSGLPLNRCCVLSESWATGGGVSGLSIVPKPPVTILEFALGRIELDVTS